MRCRLHCVLFLGLFTWTTSQNTSDETNDSNDSNDSNTTDNATLEDGSLGVSVTCYPEEDILLGNPATCVLKGDLTPVQDWDKLSFGMLQTEVLCRDYDEIAPCNVSDDVVVYENGWPVHIDVVESFRNGGPGDWVQLVALGMAAWWAVGLIVGLGACYRWWDLDPPASRDALLQGLLRQLVAMSLGILWYLSAWGSPRRGGWFYAPYCPNSEHKEMFRLGFSFWCFANSGLTHAILCMGGAVFHTIFILRSLYPENIIFLPSSEVPKFLETVLEASPVCNSLHYEEADVAFTWENGRTDDLRLKSWKQELCKRSNNCLTLEIHIRPADTFSTGSIQSLGYAFYLRLKDMRPIKEGSVQVYQALVRSSWLFRSRAGVGIFLERFVTNLLMLGLAHEAYFQHFGVDSACLRLEKRVRLLPEEELEKLCGDCFTLGTSHLSRVKDFKARAMRGVAEAETQATPLQAADGEDSIKRALSVRSREKNEMMRVQGLNSEGAWSRQADIPSDHESDRDAPTSSDEEAEASPLRPSCSDVTPSRLGMPALLDVACEAGGGRVPANSPAASTASLSRPSAHRFARGAASKEDWTRLVHKANTFILRSYVAMAEREPITKYVEEATRAFLDAWEFGSLKEDPIAAHLVLDKVKSQYNKHLSKALACLDLQSVDDLRAAAEGSAGSGPEIQLMDPAVMKMMTCHSRYLLQMAMAIGDRKALALALVESCRLMGDLPDAALWQPAVDPRPEDDGEEARKEEEEEAEEDPVPAEAPVAAEGPEEEEEEEEEGALQGTLAGPCAFDGGPGLPEGELQCRPNTPARSIDSADLVLADPGPLWSSLHRSFAEGAGPATPLPARSCAQLLQMAREMYRQKLFDESQQLLLTEAARELLGDGLDHFGEAWMQQQLSVMRSKQVGSLDPRSKRELESPKFIRSLQALFDLTTRQVITRDRQGKLPTRLKVVKAKRSVNLDAYRAYYARRAEIEQALAQPAPGAETATRLDDCLTIGPTGCYLSRELRLMQGVWLDADTGSRWLIDGDQVYRVPVLAAQLLDPTKAAAIHDSEDVQQLRPVQQPVVVSVEVSGPAEMRPRVPQFAREIRKRAKDDEDCEENPQDKMPVKATYHGWLDESGMRVTWRCEKTATFFSWERETNFQGIWRIAGSYCLLMHVDAFREGAKHLDSRKSRLGKVSRSRRGEAWFDREVQKLCEEGRDCGEAQAPTFLMHLVGELFPIWTDMSPNIMTFRSTTFKGFVDYEGSEICAEPMSESERPRMSAFRPRRTLLGRRTTHVVQPFLSKTWGYRESATVDLSAKELNLKSNELWLFHGTRESAAESITENEFQLKMAGTNRGTMFGPGIYMADAVTKSDEYTEPDPTGLRTMILCRCTMGRAIKQFEGGRECMKACHAGGFHSVKGLRAYNEYIVYDENQVYAEYIIWYRRVYNIE